MPTPNDPPRPSPRQRWLAAQRLALGESVEAAAAHADLENDTLDALLREPRFVRQVAAERSKLQLPENAWRSRLRAELRQAVERALADGKASSVGALLRLDLDLPDLGSPSAKPPRKPASAPPPTEPPAAPSAPVDTVPPVEAEPAGEPRRHALLARLNPTLRPILAASPLDLLEHYVAATDPDPTAYEAWHGARAKPPVEAARLPDGDLAAIRHVTRHNPAWLEGDYLGFYRPSAPAHAFAANDQGPRSVDEPATATGGPAPAAGPESAVAALRRRVARLLDRSLPRLPEELELAEAICAVRWPNWPAYEGTIDLIDLRVALEPIVMDAETLHWLGSHAFAQACRAGLGAGSPQAP